jgi:hypothetical protein
VSTICIISSHINRSNCNIKCDEDIPTLVPSSPLNDDQTIASKKDPTDDIRIGPIMRARAKLLEQQVTRVNSANVLDEGLRIGEIGRWMNSKVELVEISVYRK